MKLFLFEQRLRAGEARANMKRFLQIGGQTREVELRMNDLNAELGGGTHDMD